MAKLPYMQFYPADWLLDTLTLTPSARGLWIDILSFMWRAEPRTGVMECTVAGWCKRLRCIDADFRAVIQEFELENICDVIKDECKDIVRFTSRRIARDETLRGNNSLYVRKYRSKKACKTDVRLVKGACKGENQNHISESESESESEEEEKKREREKKIPAPLALSVGDVMVVWNATPGVRVAQSLTGPIKKTVEQRIKEHPDLSWFTELFQRVSRSDFLTGRSTDFTATLDWVLRPKNLAKIQNGNYDNRVSAKQSDPNGFLAGLNAFIARGSS